jgi:hypothetical protein
MGVAVIPDAGKLERLADLQVATRKLRLGKTSITINADTVIGDFTEADFGGYAAVTLAWGSASIDGDDNAEDTATDAVFTRGASGSNNTIYNWYITDSGGTKLYSCRALDVAVPLNGNGDTLTISIQEFQGDLP